MRKECAKFANLRTGRQGIDIESDTFCALCENFAISAVKYSCHTPLFGYWVLDTRYWILGTGFWILGTGNWVQGTGYRLQGTGYRVVWAMSWGVKYIRKVRLSTGLFGNLGLIQKLKNNAGCK